MGKRYKFCLVFFGFLISFPFLNVKALFSVTQEVEGSVVVPENNYCINNGFNSLANCMLVMENYSTSVDEATNYIKSKGDVNFSKIAPTITYKEVQYNMTSAVSTTAHYTLGTDYTFNTSTGYYTLKNYTNDVLSDDYIGYYTCGGTTGTSTSCPIMYKIGDWTTSTDSNGSITYRITSGTRYTYDIYNSLDSEIGLYSVEDDYGDSYYYRGDVKNNYVSFAGYIWRIIRRNGDGTVRLIYSGTSTSATGGNTVIGNSQFNSKYYDPTYVGYMYSEDFELNETNTTNTGYNNFNQNTVYYFGSGYTFNEGTGKFSLTGSKTSGKFKDLYSETDTTAFADYPYTCFSTSETGTCNVMIKLKAYQGTNTATVNLISYSSKSYESTLTNTTDSTIKIKVDDWYKSNILNKYDSYLADEVFCSDRSLYYGSGYFLVPSTNYGASGRLASKKTPSLKCTQLSDQFTTSVTSLNGEDYGNGKLTYPVGLITADEVSLAGGVNGYMNGKYYLYTGANYWTFSPSNFNSWSALAYVWIVNSTGSFGNIWSTASFDVRPVVNLNADVLITRGDGTSENPYIVAMG